MTTTLRPDDQVQLTNNSDLPLTWMVGGREFACPAGRTVHVPFDLMRMYFGDPRSGPTERLYQDESGQKIRIPSRETEMKRLNVYYGVEAAQAALRADAEREGKAIPPMPTIDEVVPSVSFTDVAGNEVKHVIEDPAGDAAAGTITNYDSPESVAAEVARLSMQLEQMRARQDAMDNAPKTDESVEEDGPDHTPKS